MKKLRLFLISKWEVFLIFFLFSSVFYMSFVLGNLDIQFYVLSLEPLLFFFFLYLLVSFFFYRKEEGVREENARLKEKIEELRSQMISESREMEDYFILWLHQMKTPITASKLLLQRELAEEKEESLKIQLSYIEQYTDMAINYLKLIKINPDMDITEVLISDLVKAVLKKYSHHFFSKNIRLELGELEGEVSSDTKWLSILFEQLLSNALKYTEEGFIRIYYNEEKRELVIEDSGIGIKSEDIPKIFDKGYSGFNGRLNQKSSGLGLFLGKKIADRLLIRICVQSKPGKGSKFSLKFSD